MGVFSQSIPDVPEDIINSGLYYITYNSYRDCYLLFPLYRKYDVIYKNDCYYLNGLLVHSPYFATSGSSEWIFEPRTSEYILSGKDFSLVYSSFDMYTESGELFFSAGEGNTITASTLSSSTIITSLKQSFLPLVPILLVSLIAYIYHFAKFGTFLKAVSEVLKKIFLVFTCLFLALSPMKATASSYQDEEPFKDVRFSIVNDPNSVVYNFDYWVLAVSPYNYDNLSSFNVCLYLIADNSESLGTSKGVLRFYTDTYPYNTKLYSVYTGGIGSPTDYKQSLYITGNRSITSSNLDINFNYSGGRITFPTSYIGGWCFDNYNLDKFPTYQGASSNYISTIILASNVDMYDQYGNLLQYGNYYTLLKYFGGTLDASKIKDWSGHETAPGVVVEPTTDSSSGGTGGDSQTSKDQLETSKGIWGTVKDVFNKLVEIAGNIVSLPFDIAVALGQILSEAFESLKNDILEGLKSLFVPSDNLFNDMRDLLEEKFKFVNQIIELVIDFNDITWKEEPPESNVTIYGVTVSFMNWEFYDDYRNLINTITVIVSYYWFVKRLLRKTPKVIGGLS